MPKQAFPYTQAGQAVFLPQDEPLGFFAARLIEAQGLLSLPTSLRRELLRQSAPDLDEAVFGHAAEVHQPLAAVVVTTALVAFEDFLRALDQRLRVQLHGLVAWPPPAKGKSGNPYGFYFYDVGKVQKHFKKLLGVDAFYGAPLPARALADWVLYRHLFSHRAGVPAPRDQFRFKHFRIAPGRRLLVAAPAAAELIVSLMRTATHVNRRIGHAAIRVWAKHPTHGARFLWGRDRPFFTRMMKVLGNFGELEPGPIRERYIATLRQFAAARARKAFGS